MMTTAIKLEEAEASGLKCPICKQVLPEPNRTQIISEYGLRNVHVFECVNCETRIIVPLKEIWEE